VADKKHLGETQQQCKIWKDNAEEQRPCGRRQNFSLL